jgi:outer membrane protein
MDFQQAHQILMYDVVERYFTVLAVQDNLQLVEQETATTERQLKQIQRQYEKNIVKITDVYELAAKLDILFADKIEVETKLDVAKQSLTELTGEPVNSLANLQNDIQFTKLPGDIKAVTEQAQINSPLIKAQEKEIKAADYDVISQQAKHIPVVDIQLQYYNTNNGYQNRQTPMPVS